jgi:hypothetical protein
MASAGTAVKVLLVVAVVVVGMVGGTQNEGTVPRTTNTHPIGGVKLTPRPTTSTNIPGGGLAGCTGEVVATESVPVGADGGVSLQVYYAATNGGRSCAMVTKTGTAQDTWGVLTVTLQLHNYDGRRWPRYAVFRHRGAAPRSAGIYLDETNGRCVRARARFDPDRGRAVTLASGKVGCGWSAADPESGSI